MPFDKWRSTFSRNTCEWSWTRCREISSQAKNVRNYLAQFTRDSRKEKSLFVAKASFILDDEAVRKSDGPLRHVYARKGTMVVLKSSFLKRENGNSIAVNRLPFSVKSNVRVLCHLAKFSQEKLHSYNFSECGAPDFRPSFQLIPLHIIFGGDLAWTQTLEILRHRVR